MIDARLQTVTASQSYPLLLMTLSGAHLYGFPSADSDYDLRGVHILPVQEVVGLHEGRETIETTIMQDGLEIDLVTYDVKKFLMLLLKKNGSVLEQIYSPLVIHTTPEHEELKLIARKCITCHHHHHYFGFAESQWKLFSKESSHQVKPLLYIYRVLLTGIHLMRTGEVESNLLRLNEVFKLSYIPELIACKLSGPEHAVLEAADLSFHRGEYERLRGELEQSAQTSVLPTEPSSDAKKALNELLIQLRLRQQQ